MEKQIEEMAKILSEDCGCCDSCGYRGILNDGIDCTEYKYADILYNAGYRKQEWHKASDELPKTSGSYIVCTDKGGVCTAHFYADCGRFNAPFGKSVKYWTCLPEPPKGE